MREGVEKGTGEEECRRGRFRERLLLPGVFHTQPQPHHHHNNNRDDKEDDDEKPKEQPLH